MSEHYGQQVADIVECFDYELCEDCGQDLNRHVISPDMFGHAHAWCQETEEA